MIRGDWVWRKFLPQVVVEGVLVDVYVATCHCHPGYLIVGYEYTRDDDRLGPPHTVKGVFYPRPVFPEVRRR